MTYLDKISKENKSVIQIQKDLKQMLDSQTWTSSFCHSSQDKMCSYTDSLLNMKRRVGISEIGYMSSVFSEDLALVIIKSCLEDNITNIANFLKSSDSSMELMGLMTDGPIGYIVNRNRTIEESAMVIISVRKNDNPCKNSSGFFIEYIYPVKLS